MIVNEDFREALLGLYEEKRMTRTSWDKISFVVMMPELNLPAHSCQEPGPKVNDRTAKHIGTETPLKSKPYFAAFMSNGDWQPGWLPTQEDLFAEDWMEIPDGNEVDDV
jgi:hypothetical protein